MPGQIGSSFSKVLDRMNIPFGVEVVGDPWDVMSSIGGRLSFILKRVGLWQLQKTVKRAGAVLYVTQHQLQKRYPAQPVVKTFAASNVKIDANFIASRPKRFPDKKEWNLLSVGSLEQLYKAPDIVIKAIRILKSRGLDIKLTWLGGGKFLEPMKSMASEFGVSDNISFLGNVGKEDIEYNLNEADLFIHVSRTEGLPRAIIEAMAKGLPVIGSNVGGIPELIDDEFIIAPDDENKLADAIESIMKAPQIYEQNSARNLKESARYDDNILSAIRAGFYKTVEGISKR